VREKLEVFKEKLLQWNRVHNLTGAKTPQEVERNIRDSLKPLEFLEGEFQRAIDIGSGAGFPGLVLAIALPETRWYLVEPRKKRAAFLTYIGTLLDLKNLQVIPKRIEEVDPFPADLITSRAVMKSGELLKVARPFIGPETTILLYKGSDLSRELEGLERYQIIKDGKRHYLILKGADIGQDNSISHSGRSHLLSLLPEEEGEEGGDGGSHRE